VDVDSSPRPDVGSSRTDSLPRSDSIPRSDSMPRRSDSDSDSTPRRSDSDSAPQAYSDSTPRRLDSDSAPRVEVLAIWKETPAGMIFGRDLQRSPTGSGWKRNQWILQIRCPTGKPLCTRGLARNGLMRLMRNSDLWLKTQPGTTSGWKTFQPASRPLAPSGSSRPRSCQEAAFGIRPGLLSQACGR